MIGSFVGFRQVTGLSHDLVQQAAHDSASEIGRMLEIVNAQYSEKIVDRLGHHDIDATFDYVDDRDAIPLPATFLTELAEEISATKVGMQVRHYSDFPFHTPGPGGPPDNFGERALAFLRDNGGMQPFVRVEDDDRGRQVMRFARARIMRESCVNCHNSHPASTKRDWQVGDVRGVLEITRALEPYRARINTGLRGTVLLTGGILFVLLGTTVAVLLVGNRRRSERFRA